MAADEVINLKTVLIIDDNDYDRVWISGILSSGEYHATTTDGGKDGLRIFAEENIDIVVTDIRMPPPDGLEVLAAVKKSRPETPVILLSDAGGIEDLKLALTYGAYDYLTKKEIQTEPERLIAAVDRAWEKLQLTRENEAYKNELEKKVAERTKELEHMKELMAREMDNYKKSKSDAFQKIQYSERKYKTLMAKAPSGIATIGVGGHITALNKAFVDVLGFQSPEQLKDQSIFNNKYFIESEFTEKILFCSEQQKEHTADRPYRGPDNKARFIEFTLTPIQIDEFGLDAEVLFTVKDITLEQEEKNRLAAEAMYDGLTGLLKHEKFYERLRDRINYAIQAGKQLGIVHIDLDDFGAINTKYKHHAASEVLKVVGQRIKSSIDQDKDLGFRVGGDEFAVIFTGYHTGSLEVVITRLFKKLSEIYTVNDGERNHIITCTFSMGVSTYSSERNQTAEKLYKEADDAMYIAKENGKNQFVFYETKEVSLA